MKKLLLCLAVLLLALTGCKQLAQEFTEPTLQPIQTTASTKPPETAVPTVVTGPTEISIESSEPTEMIAPTETVKPTEPKPLEVADWQLDQAEYLSYEAYFSVEREFAGDEMWAQSTHSWIKGKYIYSVRERADELIVYCTETAGEYAIPNSEPYASYRIAGANGRFAYLYNESKFLRIDLATGKAELILQGQKFCGYPWGGFFLCDNLVAYYASYVNEELTIGRLYLPTLKNDILYTAHAEYYDLLLYRPETNKAPIVWTLKNPDFVAYLKAELKKPNSTIKTGEHYDYSAIWHTDDAFETIMNSPMHIHNLQDSAGIGALLKCEYDIEKGELTRKTGIVDSCFHGSDFGHDHYNPEITSAPEPELLMSPWSKLNADAAVLLYREKSSVPVSDAKFTVVSDADSVRYLYARTDSDYKKLVNTPIAWAMDTGTCLLYTTADKQTLFAISYDGMRSAELLRAARGGFLSATLGYEKNCIALRDGDTFIAVDLTEGCCRQLIRHQHLRSYYYIDPGFANGKSYESDDVYFEVCVGMHVAGYTINMESGELRKGYRL